MELVSGPMLENVKYIFRQFTVDYHKAKKRILVQLILKIIKFLCFLLPPTYSTFEKYINLNILRFLRKKLKVHVHLL